MDVMENEWGSQWSRETVCAVHLSFTIMQASSAQWAQAWVTHCRNKDQEVDLGNGRLGFWLPEWQMAPPASEMDIDHRSSSQLTSIKNKTKQTNKKNSLKLQDKLQDKSQWRATKNPGWHWLISKISWICYSMALGFPYSEISKCRRGLPCKRTHVFQNN